jgi:membrane protein implicated in regulation of membrane protease activity
LNEIQISTWYWLTLGVALILVEVFLPGMLMVWLGVGACVVAIISIFFKLTLVIKLIIWAGVSSVLLTLWYKVFRDNDSTRAGRAEATLGYTGHLIRAVGPNEHSSVRFARPILGNDVWECESESALPQDAVVKVVAVVGREGLRVKVMPV